MSRSRALAALGPLAIVLALALGWAAGHWRMDPLDRLQRVPAEATDPPGTIARAGYLIGLSSELTGHGLTGLGFLTPAEASADGILVLDGRTIRGRGLVFTQLALEAAGPLPIRLAAPAGTRLVWRSPERRGAPEYLPADRLAAARDTPYAPSRRAGWMVLGAAVLLLGATGLLLRARLAQVRPQTWRWMACVLIAAFAVRAFDLGAAGRTWDEDAYFTSGRNYVDNVLNADLDEESWQWNREHPPVTKYLAGIAAQLSDDFAWARAISALELALACALLVPIGARLGSPLGGLFAGGIAALTPHLIAHGKIVGHEAPSALWWTLGVLVALEVHREAADSSALPRRTLLLRLAGTGAVVGLAAATRFIGALLGPMAVAVVLITAPRGQRLRTLGWATALIALVAAAVFYALWPLLWRDPIGALQRSWGTLRTLHPYEPFGGSWTNTPPRTYFLRYLAATAPLGLLLGCLLAAIHVVRARAHAAVTRGALVVLAWFALPLVVSFSPVRQDGVRYVLPSLLAMSLAAGLGFAALASALSTKRRWIPPVLAAALAAYLGLTCWRAHPYYLDYYNELTGGPAQVSRQRRFETAWWGEGLDRAVDYVNRHAARGAVVNRSCVAPMHLMHLRADLWPPMTEEVKRAEWIVAYSPATMKCKVPASAQRVFAVVHQGLTLVEVYHQAR